MATVIGPRPPYNHFLRIKLSYFLTLSASYPAPLSWNSCIIKVVRASSLQAVDPSLDRCSSLAVAAVLNYTIMSISTQMSKWRKSSMLASPLFRRTVVLSTSISTTPSSISKTRFARGRTSRYNSATRPPIAGFFTLPGRSITLKTFGIMS